jgi:DNA-binding GntR family transcriptional regulator
MANKQLLTNKVFEVLRYRIVSLEYYPGMKLIDKDICDEMEVSRTPVRNALKKLHDMGLVTILPRFGTKVSVIDLEDIKSAFTVRIPLEELAGREAAKHVSPDELNEMKEILKTIEEIEAKPDCDPTKRLALGTNFHQKVYMATNNRILCDFMERLSGRCIRAFNYAVRTTEMTPDDYNLEHLREIYRALTNHDGDLAGRLCRIHVERAMAILGNHILSVLRHDEWGSGNFPNGAEAE